MASTFSVVIVEMAILALKPDPRKPECAWLWGFRISASTVSVLLRIVLGRFPSDNNVTKCVCTTQPHCRYE